MKTLRFALGAIALTAGSGNLVRAQDQQSDIAPAQIVLAPMTAEQLEQLVGPIALYPDPLIALILPASTEPTDIVLAARHLRTSDNNLSQVESRAWDDSVKSLAHYPDVLKWMDENLNWTKQLGEQFTLQPAEVMKAVQRLRARARANGTLVDTPQQQIVTESTAIRIVPAEPDYIYVPYYDPAVVFMDRPVYYSRPLLTFGTGWRVGSWLAYDFDWHRCHIWVGDRHRRWHIHHDWRRPIVPVAHVHVPHYTSHRPTRQWTPPPGHRFHRPGHTTTRSTDSGASQALHRAPPLQIASPSHLTPHEPGPNRGQSHGDVRRHNPTVSSTQRTVTSNPTSAAPASAPHLTYRGNAPIMGPTVAPQPVVAAAPAPQQRSYSSARPTHESRSVESRSRGHQASAAAAPLPTAPPLQMASPAMQSRHYPTVNPPAPTRSHSAPVVTRYEAPAAQPAAAPAPQPQAAPAPTRQPTSAADGDRHRGTRNAEER